MEKKPYRFDVADRRCHLCEIVTYCNCSVLSYDCSHIFIELVDDIRLVVAVAMHIYVLMKLPIEAEVLKSVEGAKFQALGNLNALTDDLTNKSLPIRLGLLYVLNLAREGMNTLLHSLRIERAPNLGRIGDGYDLPAMAKVPKTADDARLRRMVVEEVRLTAQHDFLGLLEIFIEVMDVITVLVLHIYTSPCLEK
ncbi:MAG: hypothetical protein HGA54_02550 [Actinobacteria bacterium]|nr:hypothetical protein [Actinomycetota bacterium]